MQILTNEFKLISKDDFDTCANYARLISGNRVEIETLYRYGKTTHKTITKKQFKEHQNEY